MRISRIIPAVIITLQLFSSCGQGKSGTAVDSVSSAVDSLPHSSETKSTLSQNVEAKTFEVIDSLGKSRGWGYDLYVDGKKAIHQPIIPAIAGNNSFASQSDAQKTGDLAASKMKQTGARPTIHLHDLDSLGIKN